MTPRFPSRPAAKALLASCLIYLVPVDQYDFTARFWGGVLVSSEWTDDFQIGVSIAYVALTLLLQALLGAAWFSFFKTKPRFLPAAVTGLGSIAILAISIGIGAVWLDARAVPALYRERESASIEWPESCRIAHAHLIASMRPRYLFLEHAGRAWVVLHATESLAILVPETCETLTYEREAGNDLEMRRTDGGITFSNHVGFRYRLFDERTPTRYGETWTPEDGYRFTPTSVMLPRQYAPGGCAIYSLKPDRVRNLPSDGPPSCPVLAGDSEWLASLDGATYSETERLVRLTPDSASSQAADVSAIGPGFLILEDLSSGRGRMLMTRESSALLSVRAPDLESRGFSHEHAEVSLDGRVVWRLPHIGDADDENIVADSSGWVWWHTEGSRPRGCCVLEWQLNGTPGTHKTNRGREIVSVSVHPSGDLIAVSVTDRHHTGSVPDAVYVLRSRDGVEVFRHYLAPLTQSRVQFVGESFLAYTDIVDSVGIVRMVEVPENASLF